MGVNIFILDRRPVKLAVAGVVQDVGSLRRFWKITELDEERAGELSASEAAVSAMPSPRAALIADVMEIPLASKPEINVSAHEVIGWDEGRTRVTDMRWDYLPVLGYAVRDPESGVFVLHEERGGVLCPLGRDRAIELGLVGPDGQIIRRGQPVITGCENIRPFLDRYADADCTLSTGAKETLMTAIEGGNLPPAAWFVGKRPMGRYHTRDSGQRRAGHLRPDTLSDGFSPVEKPSYLSLRGRNRVTGRGWTGSGVRSDTQAGGPRRPRGGRRTSGSAQPYEHVADRCQERGSFRAIGETF